MDCMFIQHLVHIDSGCHGNKCIELDRGSSHLVLPLQAAVHLLQCLEGSVNTNHSGRDHCQMRTATLSSLRSRTLKIAVYVLH
jgi:hypothetical protein